MIVLILDHGEWDSKWSCGARAIRVGGDQQSRDDGTAGSPFALLGGKVEAPEESGSRIEESGQCRCSRAREPVNLHEFDEIGRDPGDKGVFPVHGIYTEWMR